MNPGLTCRHEWGPRMRDGKPDVRTHFPNQPNSKWRHLDVMYHVCARCRWVGFRYLHSSVMYTWNPEDAKEPDQSRD